MKVYPILHRQWAFPCLVAKSTNVQTGKFDVGYSSLLVAGNRYYRMTGLITTSNIRVTGDVVDHN